MTKQELEKAIENGESVWYADFDFNVVECVLISKNKPELKKPNYLYCYAGNEYEYRRKLYIDRIFNTKAQAEHYLNHANITRTETLPFLTWEEFLDEKFVWFIDKEQNQCCLYYLNVNNNIFINVSGEVIEFGDLTEENFYKAYDECVKLFKGCEDE